ncbi:protein-glutamine gamma-glutamyltransferase 5-like [Parambassis ranga]|uniref:Protein-glutamine gamma-glutamyltransferase 5-like n=1 Tax=Parambassis ranga TaxID=210632 RepID=A0A6P7IE51_9TELE|nr:protein-glutamine gamma-glutamyltransferase 5-like [Parambassis ranga]
MDYMQQATLHIGGADNGHCRLKLVDFQASENHISHETQGLSEKHLVVRRGKPFKLTLMFHSRLWSPLIERMVLVVCLDSYLKRIPVQFFEVRHDPHDWSATIYPGDMYPQAVTIHICSPVLSPVAMYQLQLHIETAPHRSRYALGAFVLLCNPWLKDDPVYMPLDVHLQEYIKSDHGVIYMGSYLNVSKRPWSFGQYEPGVLEACLKLLQVSTQHLTDKQKDYILRAQPAYLSRVVCAMVNCNDDLGILEGKWEGSYKAGVKPTDWSSSADILLRWASNCSPVRFGQCWVFASVLCTVMRVLGIPSRVVTVFNAAHDTNANMTIEEFYTSRGEKLSLSKDSIWNFHVWVECWMRRPDLGVGFDGWQIVDPTPQEKSGGTYCCGPCPVAAIQRRCLGARYDVPFICASMNADVIQLVVRDGLVVGRTVDTESVGRLIYTKRVGSDSPENLTQIYKGRRRNQPAAQMPFSPRTLTFQIGGTSPQACRPSPGRISPSLEVSLNIDRVPSLGDSIHLCVTVTNHSSSPRSLVEHVNAQLKDYNSDPQGSFWNTLREVHMKPHEVLTLHHAIAYSEYESVLAGDDIMNVAVVIKDVRTTERFLAAQEFSISPPEITIEIKGGDRIQMKKEHTAKVSFTNHFTKPLKGAVLMVQGSGLLQGKRESRLVSLQPGEKIEIDVSIMAASPGTKLLMATFSHSNSSSVISRTFHKVSVTTA